MASAVIGQLTGVAFAPLRVLAVSHNPPSEGCAFARIVTPLAALRCNGTVNYGFVHVAPLWFLHPNAFRRVLQELPQWDVIWVTRPLFYVMLPVLRAARRLGKPILVDMDDWLLDTPPDHIDAGLVRSRSLQETLRTALRAADAVTASTPLIAERCAAMGVRAHVLLNAIDCAPFVRQQSSDDRVTIAFCGGPSHAPDLSLVEGPLRHLLQEQGDRVRVVSLGCPIPALQGMHGYEHHKSVAATEYARTLSSLRIDIGLAPLRDTPFNRAKSDIKYLEYSAAGAVTVASPTSPYQDSIRSDRGVLAAANTPEAWFSAIRCLIDNPPHRRELAANAYAWVRSERSIDAMADTWHTTFRQYTDGYVATGGPGARQLDAGRFERVLANVVIRELDCFGRIAPALAIERVRVKMSERLGFRPGARRFP